jgi:ABC-type nitrate/sulfonate/bicarbonate transport system ATPase subunit
MRLSCRAVGKVYETPSGPVHALEDVTFSARERELICLVGPSGCGKTTLLKLITGLLSPSAGEIDFDPCPVDGRLRSALVFQGDGLFPWMSVLDNVAFGLEARGIAKQPRRERAQVLLDAIGLGVFADHYPHQLSMGMRQRAGLARALLIDPHVLLMDEPLGSLDAQTKLVLREEILRVWERRSTLLIYVTHDIDEAVLMGDRVLVMTGPPGRIHEEIVIHSPRPAEASIVARPDLVAIRDHIWQMLKDSVRKHLWLSS